MKDAIRCQHGGRWSTLGPVARLILTVVLAPLILIGTPFRWLAERRLRRGGDVGTREGDA